MVPEHQVETVMRQIRNFIRNYIHYYSEYIYTTIDDVTYNIQTIKTNIMNNRCYTIILTSNDDIASELNINIMLIENHISKFNSQNNTMSFDILAENNKKHYVKQIKSHPFDISNSYNEITNYFISQLTYITRDYHQFNQCQKEGER